MQGKIGHICETRGATANNSIVIPGLFVKWEMLWLSGTGIWEGMQAVNQAFFCDVMVE